MKGAAHRLEFLTRQLSAPEWRLLGAIAVERELAASTLLKLAAAFGMPAQGMGPRSAAPSGGMARTGTRGLRSAGSALAPLPELAEWLARGLLIETARASGPLRAGTAEQTLAVHPDYRQLVVRRLAAQGELQAVVEATHGALGERSLGLLVLFLQTGRLAEFQRHTHAVPRATQRLAQEVDGDVLLREAIACPFDGVWFENVWREAAPAVAQRVLRDALLGLDECDQVFAWLQARLSPAETGAAERARAESAAFEGGVEDLPSDVSLRHTLAEHAFLRGRPELLDAHAPLLPREARLGFLAAAAYQSGARAAAERWLDLLLSDAEASVASLLAERADGRREAKRARSGAPNLGAATPLLALLLVSRGTPDAEATARRWLSARAGGESLAGAERGLRTLLRYAALPQSECVRLDVYQLAPSARGWELLLLGLTVHLFLEQEVTRAAWAIQLTRSGARWIEAGYSWLGRQALLLARALSANHFEREFSGLEARRILGTFEQRPGELALFDLITPKPDWQRALDALEQLAEQPGPDPEGLRRVAWFVNLVDQTLDRPALQELGQGGWSRGRRLPLGQLYAHAAELPPEDRAVLLCTREAADGKREFLPEAFEALIGHPRVFHGARGGARVDVVAGVCRVETSEAGELLHIHVEPAGARLGINLVVEGDTRLCVYRVTPAMQRVIDVLSRGLSVPVQRADQALRVLGKLSQGVEVHSRHLGADRQIEADATPCLRIAPRAGAWLVQAGVRPFGARGRFFLAGTGKVALSQYSEGARLLCVRDLELERARLSRLIAACPSLLEHCVNEEPGALEERAGSWDFDLEGLLDLLLELRESGEACELEWPESEALHVRGKIGTSSLHGSLRRKKGWYLASGGVAIDRENEASLAELAGSVAVAQGRFVRLPNGDFLALEERVRRVVAVLQNTEPLPHHPRDLRIHEGAFEALSVLGELAAEAAGESGFEFDAEARAWLERVEAVKAQPFDPPSTLTAELRSYQLAGFRWLACLSALGLGACLADDMGLGKTVQILALLLTRTAEGPALVVAPTSVCTNWLLEAARFAPGLAVREYAGPEREGVVAPLLDAAGAPPAQVIVCSYGLLQQDVELLARVSWGTLVLDEAQFIKNPKSLRAQAAQKLDARFRIAATGTPVENHLGDLWSIFHFLSPGLLGSWRSFSHRFLKPIEQRHEEEARRILQDVIRPFILRRTKAEVLADLPPLTLVHHPVRLSEAEALAYDRLRRDIAHKLTRAGRRDNKLEILAEITRLRRFCCHPRLVLPEFEGEGSKLGSFLDLALELRESQHRALVFSQFVDFLDLVRERLEEVGIQYQYLDGSTPKAERQARVQAFQAGEGTLFVISLKAGGFGLNLTAADYVIHLDPWWNPAVEAQATDRAHRIGQERPVTVYRLITKDTIEESIVQLYETKRALAEALLSDGERAAQLSAAELVDLIGVPA